MSEEHMSGEPLDPPANQPTSTSGRTPLPYGSRTTWWRFTLGIAVLGALELFAGHLIVGRLLGPVWAMAFDVVLGVATVALLIGIASPLWAEPYVDHDRGDLVGDLGLLGGTRIPLSAICAAEPFEPPLLHPVSPGAAVTGDPPCVSYSRGGDIGFIRMRLERPVRARHSFWRHEPASVVVLQCADPKAAVDAISAAVSGHRPGGNPATSQ